MDEITGRCLCGATRYSANGPPKFSIVCYCTDCQKVTGAGHAPQLAVQSSGLDVKGPLRTHRAKADSGNDLAFQFCGDCGSPVIKSSSRMTDTVFVYAGSLDDPTLFQNPNPIFEDSRLPWDT